MIQQTNDLRVITTQRIPSPSLIKSELPMSQLANEVVVGGRGAIQRILRGEERRLLVVVGPCSIHDPVSALEYAGRLHAIRSQVEDQLLLVMRVYFEKPRTTIGWKGMINDPHLDGSYDVNCGIRAARKLLLDVNELGLPAATEFLDPIIPQFIADLVTWAAIGARTTESQTHREMASGLSMPVGFKNGTDGSLQTAVDAMLSSRHPHHFLGIDQEGYVSVVRTTGNTEGHVVLRGGRGLTNYDSASIATAASQLRKSGLPEVLMVDCSHANSLKQHAKQEEVWRSVVAQKAAGSPSLMGVMVESHLSEGNQPMPVKSGELKYGVSLTDACLGWEATERMLLEGAEELRRRRANV